MVGSVYDYYLSTYASKPATKSDTHKKSELRSIYNNIVKISKKSPLYKVNVSDDLQKYAIDLKENARSLSNNAGSLFSDSDFSSSKKKYVSSNDDVITVNMLENDNSNEDYPLLDSYNIEVKNLATPQINTSAFLSNSSLSIPKGEHIFEVNVGDSGYEFQIKATDTDTNKSIFEKLSRLINRSNIGLSSEVVDDGYSSALQIKSDSSGLTYSGNHFTITPSTEHPDDDIVSTLGLDYVSTQPSNANFLLNGMEKTSSSNIFTINKAIEVSLKDISEEGVSTSISLNDDLDSAIDSVNEMIDSYNKLIDLSNDKAEASDDALRLNKEIGKTSSIYKNDLESVGITIADDGKLSFDNSLFIQAAREGTLGESLDKLNAFKTGIIAKAEDISINPMKYVNKTMISYPNPVKSFANPYITSIYSGMMFNGYI